VKYLALGSILLLAVAGSAAGQQPSTNPAAQDPVFRSGASLVALNITVTDGDKKYVTGLKSEDFSIYEDGVQQHVQFFEAHEVPVDLIVLLDASSSMSDKMGVVHEAALGFLSSMRPADRGAVVAFSDGVEIVQTLTSDRQLLEDAVRRTKPHGATALYNALYVALKQFGRAAQQTDEVRRQAIAVLSDGEDTSSLVTFDDVLGVARKSGVSIYTIGLQSKYAAARAGSSGGRRYFSESEYSLKTLAQETGAQSFFPNVVNELKGIYALIAEELSAQYSIGYSPTNSRADGRFRRIVVRITSRPELRPRARAGYVAEAIRTAAVSSSPSPSPR
jgi:Ca-activated chloride channel family protein